MEDFIASLNDIPSDSHVIFAGDFNFYTSNEEGYQRLIDQGNPIVMIDPIDRPSEPFPSDSSVSDPFEFYHSSSIYFWSNSSFMDIHTQSTRTSNSGLIDDSGSTGGLDDRFDFIMMSENFIPAQIYITLMEVTSPLETMETVTTRILAMKVVTALTVRH